MSNNNSIFKDYTLKIKTKLYNSNITSGNLETISDDINNLIILLNWCFLTKNNFFVSNFNNKCIFSVNIFYNQLKTNILSKNLFDDIDNIFDEIPKTNLKTIKFILHNYINNYDSISSIDTNKELCEKISKVSIKNCIDYINLSLEK
jgi:hypothetical protein